MAQTTMTTPDPIDLLSLDPVPNLLTRVRGELGAAFVADRPIRVARAPGRLDVMGGIADYTGSLVCEATLDRAAAVALQGRDDRRLQVFSFNLFDQNLPFTFAIDLDDLIRAGIDQLRSEFAQPGRQWAAYLAGCLYILHEQGYLDVANENLKGVNIALDSTVPLGAGVSSSAAIEVATMLALVDHYGVGREDGPAASAGDSQAVSTHRNPLTALSLAELCQQVENRVVGAPCGLMDQVASCAGRKGELMRMVCQPHELQPSLSLPKGIRVIGINSNVKHSVGGGMYGQTRCAAFMGHKIILKKMADMGTEAGRDLISDPMHGYLANLVLEDYKRYFRQYLPEQISGEAFLNAYGPTIDKATSVDPQTVYHVLSATDHHVFEPRRVCNFVDFIEQANRAEPQSAERSVLLDKAGHLMYASHVSYTDDAKLGADECDLLVSLVRKHEKAGLYGAKITGGGSGGTVAALAAEGKRVDAAIAQIMTKYEAATGRKPEAFTASSPGAWQAGTQVVYL